MGHAGAADGFNQRLFNDAVFDVQGQFAGALLRGTPAHAVGEAVNIGDLTDLVPLPFLGNGGRAVV